MTISFSRRAVLAAGAAATGTLLLDQPLWAAANRRVLVWSEGTAPKKVYPKDINTAVADGLQGLPGWDVATAGIDDPDQGVSDATLDKTDVLIWWGHTRHGQVKDDRVARIVERVKQGKMGFIALHSSHFSKALKRVLGTECSFSAYVCDGSAVLVTVADKAHPIAKGVKDFKLDQTERYSEPYKVPPPESVVFDGTYLRPDGSQEKSRQGLCWTVGQGKVFYFQPGHETYPHFFDANVRQIMRNAVLWAAPGA